MTCIVLLALSLVQKIPPVDAAELARKSPVCVRAAPIKGKDKAQVLDVLWGSQLGKGDVFQTVEQREYPGMGLWFPHPVVQDSVIFMTPHPERGGETRWFAETYRIAISDGVVKYDFRPVYSPRQEPPRKQEHQLLLDGGIAQARVRFRVDVPRKSKTHMTYAEVKAELLRLRSKVNPGRAAEHTIGR